MSSLLFYLIGNLVQILRFLLLVPPALAMTQLEILPGQTSLPKSYWQVQISGTHLVVHSVSRGEHHSESDH